MAKKRFSPKRIVTLLRQIEVATASGKSVSLACREAGISDQSYFRWCKEYGGLGLDQARRMKDLTIRVPRPSIAVRGARLVAVKTIPSCCLGADLESTPRQGNTLESQ
jgi:transposase-like protein